MTENITDLRTQKQSIAKLLLRMAWTIEIMAAILGLSIGIALTAEKMSIADIRFSQLIYIFLPWFVVAIVELVKIPLASVLYLTESFKWRVILGLGLIAATIITFETFSVGFELNQNVRTSELTALHSKIAEKKSIINSYEDKDGNLQIRDLNAANFTNCIIDGSLSTEVSFPEDENLTNQMNVINKEYSKKNSETNLLESIEKRLLALKKERDDAINVEERSRTEELESAKSEGENVYQIRLGQISRLQNEMQAIRDAAQKEYDSCNFLGCSRIMVERDKKLAAKDKRINNLQMKTTATGRISQISTSTNLKITEIRENYKSRIEELNERIATQSALAARSIGKKTPEDESRLKELQAELKKLTAEENQQKNIATEDFNERMEENALIRTTAKVALKDKVQAEKDKEVLCSEFNTKVLDNQIYRIAMRLSFSDKTQQACDLNQDHVNLVAAIWFGSIALIVALLGTLLAFGSFLMSNPPRPSNPSKSFGGLLRGIIYGLRKRMKNPKIIKEVVEKEVKVEVERIKEVIVPEVRYVKEEVKVEAPIEVKKEACVYR